MERDIQRIRETLGQMVQLSLMTDRTYRMAVRSLGSFHLNWTHLKDQGEADVLWEYEDGRPVRVTLENQDEQIDEYFRRMGIEAFWPGEPEPTAAAIRRHA
ncbi:MAG: hypothetical protein RRB13_09235 [bacterium]|nr:hypothetical protein [bacterium]